MAIAAAAAACGGAEHRGPPQGPEAVPDNPEEVYGETLFQKYCYQCHPGGGAGLGPALNDKPLPELAIKEQVRRGAGEMPAFSEELLPNADVDAIADYVDDLRHTPSRH
jgi:mono/diheme cytochrome c family protein